MSRSIDPVPAPPLDIAQRLRDGDVAAFEQLFRTHYAALCGFAHRYLRDTGESEDLVQQLFADLWANHPRLDLRGGARAYLFTAVRNRALNVRKRRLTHDAWERDESNPDVRELHPTPPQPDLVLETAERTTQLRHAVESLPERCRLVMQLRWQEQMSYAEIAAVMGISVKGVENQLSRGLNALRHRLGIGEER